MSDFFNSEIVKKDIKNISSLQKKIYKNIFVFPSMNKEDKIKHIHMVNELIEKQKLLYTRLSLSEDPDAQDVKQQMVNYAVQSGMNPQCNLIDLFNSMSSILTCTKNRIDNN
ncbi:DUF1825 family protein [bacterium]|nr:DUF1825 family protein [bacterium]